MSAATGLSATAREQTARIARLNDLARRAMGVACTAVATVGFRSLDEADQSRVRELVETYSAFDEDNDPYGERAFGCIYQLGDGRWTAERGRRRSASVAGRIVKGAVMVRPIARKILFHQIETGA